jgi:hypothetical protein
MKNKHFQIILEPELYNEWLRWWGGHGIRQYIMRRVVRLMVDRARERNGLEPMTISRRGSSPPKGGTLSEQLDHLIKEELDHAAHD